MGMGRGSRPPGGDSALAPAIAAARDSPPVIDPVDLVDVLGSDMTHVGLPAGTLSEAAVHA